MTDLYERDRREGIARWDAHVRSQLQPPAGSVPDFAKRVAMGRLGFGTIAEYESWLDGAYGLSEKG